MFNGQDRGTYEEAVKVLCTRVDPGNQTLAAFDFCHVVENHSETVVDYIRRLERTFQ